MQRPAALFLASTLFALGASVASAEPIQGPAVVVTAVADDILYRFEVPADQLVRTNGRLVYQSAQPITLIPPNQFGAGTRVDDLRVEFTPVDATTTNATIDLNYSVRSGDTNIKWTIQTGAIKPVAFDVVRGGGGASFRVIDNNANGATHEPGFELFGPIIEPIRATLDVPQFLPFARLFPQTLTAAPGGQAEDSLRWPQPRPYLLSWRKFEAFDQSVAFSLTSGDTAQGRVTLALEFSTRCGAADIASPQLAIGPIDPVLVWGPPDGELTADDIIAFLNGFFAGDTQLADLAQLGGTAGPDGLVTADDMIFFLRAFFIGCP
jgi:hypothetical protein